MFIIAEFIEEDLLEIIPKSWLLSQEQCLWPPRSEVRSYEMAMHIRKQTPPEASWNPCRINILSEATDFEEARKKLRKLASSDYDGDRLTTDPEDYGKGKRKKRQVQLSSSDEETTNEKVTKIKQMLPQYDSFLLDDDRSESIISPTPVAIPAKPVTTGSEELMNVMNAIGFSSQSNPNQVFGSSSLARKKIQNAKTTEPQIDSIGALRIILNNQLMMRNDLKKLTTAVDNLVNLTGTCQCKQASGHAESPPQLVNFPVSTLEDLVQLEKAVEEEGTRKFLVKKFKKYGGTNLADHTRRILRNLVTDEMAEHFSWVGTKKRNFSNLKIAGVIVDAVSESDPSASRIKIEDAIKSWLRHAKERSNYKKKNDIVSDVN